MLGMSLLGSIVPSKKTPLKAAPTSTPSSSSAGPAKSKEKWQSEATENPEKKQKSSEGRDGGGKQGTGRVSFGGDGEDLELGPTPSPGGGAAAKGVLKNRKGGTIAATGGFATLGSIIAPKIAGGAVAKPKVGDGGGSSSKEVAASGKGASGKKAKAGGKNSKVAEEKDDEGGGGREWKAEGSMLGLEAWGKINRLGGDTGGFSLCESPICLSIDSRFHAQGFNRYRHSTDTSIHTYACHFLPFLHSCFLAFARAPTHEQNIQRQSFHKKTAPRENI